MLAVVPGRCHSVAMNPFAFLVICLAGWMHRNQQEVIEYLQEEVRVLKELLGKQPRFNDDQRRRLALKSKRLGRKALDRFASLVAPNTLLAWHRRLVAQKYGLESGAQTGTANHQRSNSRTDFKAGPRESHMGLHANSRGTG
jgi:hypothetical protein